MRKIISFIILLLCFSTITGTASVAMAASALPDIQPLPEQENPYKARSELLMNATKYVGVSSPEQAATVWAEGLKGRSAAMQYIVMADKLKTEYAKQLDEKGSNWVTGQSSPSIQSYKITKITKPDNMHAEISLSFAEGYVYEHNPSAIYKAKLWLIREVEFWQIERIALDKGLEGYTWYTP